MTKDLLQWPLKFLSTGAEMIPQQSYVNKEVQTDTSNVIRYYVHTEVVPLMEKMKKTNKQTKRVS